MRIEVVIFADIVGPTCVWERFFYAWIIIFYWIDVPRPLCVGWYLNQIWIRLEKGVWKYLLWNSFRNFFFNVFLTSFEFFDVFLFQSLIEGKYLSIYCFSPFYCLKMAPKISTDSKYTKGNKRSLQNEP